MTRAGACHSCPISNPESRPWLVRSPYTANGSVRARNYSPRKLELAGQLIILPGWHKLIEAFFKRVCTLIARTALFECEPLHISEFSACRIARPMSDLGLVSRSVAGPNGCAQLYRR